MTQQTIRNSIRAAGLGRVLGKRVQLRLLPAEPNSGIVFRRTDCDPQIDIPATLENVPHRLPEATLQKDGYQIWSADRLLATFYGLGIDNVIVELDGPEVPHMDGSAAPWVFLIQAAGIVSQSVPRRIVELTGGGILSRDKKGWARLLKADSLRIACIDSYDSDKKFAFSPGAVVDVSAATFITDICYANSSQYFIPMSDNGERLRRMQANNFALDIMADLCLLPGRFVGVYAGCKASRQLNLNLLKKLITVPAVRSVGVLASETHVESYPMPAFSAASGT